MIDCLGKIIVSSAKIRNMILIQNLLIETLIGLSFCKFAKKSCLTCLASNLAQKIKMYGDRGSPWRVPSNEKIYPL